MLTNRFRRALLPAVSVIAAIACGGPTTPAVPTVGSVQVTPGVDSLTALGQMHQFTAGVKDGNGNPMAGKTVVWQSSLRTVATVDAAGATPAANSAMGPQPTIRPPCSWRAV